MVMAETQTSQDQTAIFEEIETYDWQNDLEFQGGLKTILASAGTPEQTERLTARAKCFYIARKRGIKVDFAAYLEWRRQWIEAASSNDAGQRITEVRPAETSAVDQVAESQLGSSPMGNAPTPASFAEICQLIAEGKPIPGIKDIPDTVLEGQGSQSQAGQRRKPWETQGAAKETPAWAR